MDPGSWAGPRRSPLLVDDLEGAVEHVDPVVGREGGAGDRQPVGAADVVGVQERDEGRRRVARVGNARVAGGPRPLAVGLDQDHCPSRDPCRRDGPVDRAAQLSGLLRCRIQH